MTGMGGLLMRLVPRMGHQSYSSMGVDAADINNDGLPDIITLDMQPETSERKKSMYSFLSEQRHQLEMDKGYEPQYVHNMLQLNVGNRPEGRRSLRSGRRSGPGDSVFSEISEMAGLAETDWSWSVLIADFDNDGWKDVHITNGLGRDPTNTDFLNTPTIPFWKRVSPSRRSVSVGNSWTVLRRLALFRSAVIYTGTRMGCLSMMFRRMLVSLRSLSAMERFMLIWIMTAISILSRTTSTARPLSCGMIRVPIIGSRSGWRGTV